MPAAGGVRLAPQRRPLWSGGLSARLARGVPLHRRSAVLAAIKATHTALFVSIAGAVLLVLWDGLRQRPRHRTAVTGAVVLAETVVYVSNNLVCPLTPLAEELGAERGSVADLFLPEALSRRIPVVAGSAAVAAALLNLVAFVRPMIPRYLFGAR